ncbi:SCO2400 family protein, partial [Streptomyces sp. NPDC004011]
MDFCHPCQRHLNGALACPGCGAPARPHAPRADGSAAPGYAPAVAGPHGQEAHGATPAGHASAGHPAPQSHAGHPAPQSHWHSGEPAGPGGAPAARVPQQPGATAVPDAYTYEGGAAHGSGPGGQQGTGGEVDVHGGRAGHDGPVDGGDEPRDPDEHDRHEDLDDRDHDGRADHDGP